MRNVFGRSVFAVAACALFLPEPARAEFSVMFYVGKSFTGNSPLRLKKGSTDLTFDNVRWEDRSFRAPIFYGYRVSYWLDRTSPWGVSVEFTHAKAIMREDDVVPVRGYRNGAAVDTRERLADTIRHFELSHGLNMVTFNGLHRWFPSGTRDLSAAGRLQPYAGLGAGFSIPHVEADFQGVKTGRYQTAAGPVINGALGANYDLTRFLSGILEYKLSYADVHADLNGGGQTDARTVTQQFISGAGAMFTPW